MDRYLASLHVPSPTYEDPYAYWGGARPALQYGLPPGEPRPDTAGWPSAMTEYGLGHTPAAFPAMSPPPMPTGLPGGPRPSTPAGSILGSNPWNLAGLYDPTRDAMSGYRGENARGRLDRWVNDGLANAQAQGLIPTIMQRHGLTDPAQVRALFEQVGAGGIEWAEQTGGAGASGFNYGADPRIAPNTLNPGEAGRFLAAGRRPGQYEWEAAGIEGGHKTRWNYDGADPYGQAAAHVTQALSQQGAAPMASDTGGMRPGNYQQGGTPGYAPATGAGGGAPGGGGGLGDVNAGYLLDPQNRAALQAYIASRGGVSPSTHSLLGNYIYDTVAPMFSSALTALGLDTAGGLQGNIDQWFQQGKGNTLFSSLRNAAQQRLGSGGFASDLAGLGDPRAQAGLLNQLINLTTTGQSALHRAATQQSLIDRQRQFELQSALSQDPTQLQNYMTYFAGLPGWEQIVGGGGR